MESFVQKVATLNTVNFHNSKLCHEDIAPSFSKFAEPFRQLKRILSMSKSLS